MKIKLIAKHGEYTIEIEGNDPVEIRKTYKDTCWELGLPVQGGHAILSDRIEMEEKEVLFDKQEAERDALFARQEVERKALKTWSKWKKGDKEKEEKDVGLI